MRISVFFTQKKTFSKYCTVSFSLMSVYSVQVDNLQFVPTYVFKGNLNGKITSVP